MNNLPAPAARDKWEVTCTTSCGWSNRDNLMWFYLSPTSKTTETILKASLLIIMGIMGFLGSNSEWIGFTIMSLVFMTTFGAFLKERSKNQKIPLNQESILIASHDQLVVERVGNILSQCFENNVNNPALGKWLNRSHLSKITNCVEASLNVDLKRADEVTTTLSNLFARQFTSVHEIDAICANLEELNTELRKEARARAALEQKLAREGVIDSIGPLLQEIRSNHEAITSYVGTEEVPMIETSQKTNKGLIPNANNNPMLDGANKLIESILKNNATIRH